MADFSRRKGPVCYRCGQDDFISEKQLSAHLQFVCNGSKCTLKKRRFTENMPTQRHNEWSYPLDVMKKRKTTWEKVLILLPGQDVPWVWWHVWTDRWFDDDNIMFDMIWYDYWWFLCPQLGWTLHCFVCPRSPWSSLPCWSSKPCQSRTSLPFSRNLPWSAPLVFGIPKLVAFGWLSLQ